MKAFVFFAVCAFVCGAQAGVILDDDVVPRSSMLQTQLNILIDYIDASLKPALLQTLEESHNFTNKIVNVTEEVIEDNNKFIFEILEIVRQNERIYEAAGKMEVNIQECGQKTVEISERVVKAVEAANKCVNDRFEEFKKKPVEVEEKINEVLKIIEENTATAKKCANEYTFATSFSTAACLTRAKVSSDAAWASAPGNLKMRSLDVELLMYVKDIKACADPKVFNKFRSETKKLTAEVKDCIYEKIFENVEENKVPEVKEEVKEEQMPSVEGVAETGESKVE